MKKKEIDQLFTIKSKLLRIFLKILKYFLQPKQHFRFSEKIINIFISKFIYTRRFDGKWICLTNFEVGKFIDGPDHKRFNKNNFSPLLMKYVKKNSIVIDIGTSYGDEVIDLSNLVGAKGKVYAFEGNKDYYEALKKTVKLNDLKNVECIFAYVGAKNSFIAEVDNYKLSRENYLKGRDMKYSSSGKSKTVALDSLIKEIGNKEVSFIKIDTDGFELEILKGAKKLLNINKTCKVISEFIPNTYYGKFKNNQVLNEYKNMGFKISKIQMTAIPLHKNDEENFINQVNKSNFMVSHDIFLEKK